MGVLIMGIISKILNNKFIIIGIFSHTHLKTRYYLLQILFEINIIQIYYYTSKEKQLRLAHIALVRQLKGSSPCVDKNKTLTFYLDGFSKIDSKLDEYHMEI